MEERRTDDRSDTKTLERRGSRIELEGMQREEESMGEGLYIRTCRERSVRKDQEKARAGVDKP